MSSTDKRNNNKQRGGQRSGTKGKNPFAQDPIQKEADKIKAATATINETFVGASDYPPFWSMFY